MKNFISWHLYIIYGFLATAFFVVAYFLSATGIMSLLIATPGVAALMLALWQIMRDNEAYKREREKFIFEKLHIGRAEAIKTLYQKLVNVQKLFLALLDDQPDDYGRGHFKLTLGVKDDDLFKALRDCHEHYLSNDLYFSKQLSQRIRSLLEELTESINSFRLIDKAHVNPYHARDRANRGALVNVPPILESIREEFRELIGVGT